MLQSLSIRNVVLIDKLDLDFQSGLSVLTGETGAGKSILLDSLGLVLGKRAETSLIRCGEDKLSVTAIFDPEPNNIELQELLSENELEVDGEIIIKRTLDQNGKGKIFFNDQPISAKLLKEIGKYLVEIHGQFDNQGLLNPVNHQDVLDAFGGHGALLSDVTTIIKRHQQPEFVPKQILSKPRKRKIICVIGCMSWSKLILELVKRRNYRQNVKS